MNMGRMMAGALLVGLLGLVVLEMTQLLVVGRHARWTELLSNSLGFLVGLLGTTVWKTGRELRLKLQGFCQRRLSSIAAGMMVIALAWWWEAGLRPVFGSLQMDWDEGFPLVVGDELDGNRTWSGEIRYAGIYRGALTGRQIARLRDDLLSGEWNERVNLGLLAGYDFRQGASDVIVPHGILEDEGLEMVIPSGCEWLPEGGVLLKKSTPLLTRSHAPALTRAIVSSGAFSVEVWIRPMNLTQAGPARILTYSKSWAERNFTLGQTGAELVFRVRNGINGPNGGIHQLETDGLDDRALQHLVAIYDHGVSRFFRNGAQMGRVIDLRDPLYYLPLEVGVASRIVIGILLVVMIALPVYFLLSSQMASAYAHGAAILLAFCVLVGPYVTTFMLVGGACLISIFAWSGGAFLVGYPLAFCYVNSASK